MIAGIVGRFVLWMELAKKALFRTQGSLPHPIKVMEGLRSKVSNCAGICFCQRDVKGRARGA